MGKVGGRRGGTNRLSDLAPDRFFSARHVTFSYPGRPVLTDLSFTLRPGLTLLRGGEDRGKTSVLRLIAGSLTPDAGNVHRAAETVYFETPADPAHGAVVARAWLDAQRSRFPAWQPEVEADLIERFGLAAHIDKPMEMLSTGSRRKVGLVAAAASGAALTLIDMPFAALDASSGRVLTALLIDAAASADRAWVIADYECPAGLVNLTSSAVIDLGD